MSTTSVPFSGTLPSEGQIQFQGSLPVQSERA